jgi:hypothetical protein
LIPARHGGHERVANTRKVIEPPQDAGKIRGCKARIAARELLNLRDDGAVNLLRRECLRVTTVAIVAAQITGDLSVTFPAYNAREDLGSRLDHAQEDHRLHNLSRVNGCSDIGGAIVSGKTF